MNKQQEEVLSALNAIKNLVDLAITHIENPISIEFVEPLQHISQLNGEILDILKKQMNNV